MRMINFSELAARPEPRPEMQKAVPRGTGSQPVVKQPDPSHSAIHASMTFADAAPLAEVPDELPASLVEVVFDAAIPHR